MKKETLKTIKELEEIILNTVKYSARKHHDKDKHLAAANRVAWKLVHLTKPARYAGSDEIRVNVGNHNVTYSFKG